MLREQAYQRFKERLFARDLVPGQFVSQRALAELVGVSEGPMREALKRLESEALVRLIPQRGVQIADVNLDLIRDAFGIRVALETWAIRQFVRTASDDELAALEDRFSDIALRIERDRDPGLLDAALDADLLLHRTMIESTGNALVAEVYRINHDKIRLIRMNGRFTFERVLPALDEHLAIVRCLRQRDAEGALAALEHHLAISLRRALGIME